ncbi:hypothetical protein PVAND_015186 [Polypedilum vanderplanki]|nr:hypothetical protein PVAND_015186 [Polypedilum vanderplanki]
MSHLYYCGFIYSHLNSNDIRRIQTLQNRCIKLIFNLDNLHPTTQLFNDYMPNTLCFLGVIIYSTLLYVKKSILMKSDHLPEFTTNKNNLRSDGLIKIPSFKRSNRLAKDCSVFGAKLYNGLPAEIKNSESINKFKKSLKTYLCQKSATLLNSKAIMTLKLD